jgi:hypothetical protein
MRKQLNEAEIEENPIRNQITKEYKMIILTNTNSKPWTMMITTKNTMITLSTMNSTKRHTGTTNITIPLIGGERKLSFINPSWTATTQSNENENNKKNYEENKTVT